MGHKRDGEIGGICGYAKFKYEQKVEERSRKRSHSEPSSAGRSHGYGKLHKAPQVHSLYERPRNRLRKPVTILPPGPRPTTDLFALEYEPYPSSTQPSKVLGLFSTFNSVTLGAFKHGAYTFSREGLLDGSEYLSPTGRIKIVRTAVQRRGVKAVVPGRSRSLDGEHVRLDIPHPGSQEEPKEDDIAREMCFLAIRVGPTSASWIGVFEDKSLAWGACLKDKAMCALSGTLCNEVRTFGLNNMPHITARLVGSGRFTWTVEEHAIDGPGRTSATPS